MDMGRPGVLQGCPRAAVLLPGRLAPAVPPERIAIGSLWATMAAKENGRYPQDPGGPSAGRGGAIRTQHVAGAAELAPRGRAASAGIPRPCEPSVNVHVAPEVPQRCHGAAVQASCALATPRGEKRNQRMPPTQPPQLHHLTPNLRHPLLPLHIIHCPAVPLHNSPLICYLPIPPQRLSCAHASGPWESSASLSLIILQPSLIASVCYAPPPPPPPG